MCLLMDRAYLACRVYKAQQRQTCATTADCATPAQAPVAASSCGPAATGSDKEARDSRQTVGTATTSSTVTSERVLLQQCFLSCNVVNSLNYLFLLSFSLFKNSTVQY